MSLTTPHRLSPQETQEGGAVSATVLYMSMSLDGLIAGPGIGLGDGGQRLHDWVVANADAGQAAMFDGVTGVNRQIVDEFMATGAVVAGRGTFEPAGGWGGDHHDGVPIFILSRRARDGEAGRWPLVSYVDDVTSA